ncbi:putative quinol monooxygenase [Nocardiopsis sp. N85]|uniref:putative quinol monooxygenase n=1 Tax=Nocardiopsis sp. N85 TaxID=3029400 RepID=UPI00237EFABD|nr:putative quinol monooxygenase [Nocardiopsis sp. N85]MDE3722547.1 putative quinol monooxygenase [Nocardiopsis sp. N85]
MSVSPLSLVISVRVLPGRRDAFVAGISRHAVTSVREEPGCLRFDVTADAADPDLFWVCEVFADESALAAHRASAHFAAWQREKALSVVPGSQVDRHGPLVVSES